MAPLRLPRRLAPVFKSLFATLLVAAILQPRDAVAAAAAAEPFKPAIPRTYVDEETATWHLPLAYKEASPTFLPAAYFYARKVRPIYRSYPVYHPDREPAGYLDRLKAAEPEVLRGDAGHKPRLDSPPAGRAPPEPKPGPCAAASSGWTCQPKTADV